ncbi:uncharacterized protein LOC18427990 isoform X1 [Amborella trichopoda]|nr:uncharacterized protein LOC18427990 isoform X1 [Amborella trichopoda]|eukprot:XP_020519193.1 uncharacterized protein LOC18427990 isoform X1 [Amborella trichopoda]
MTCSRGEIQSLDFTWRTIALPGRLLSRCALPFREIEAFPAFRASALVAPRCSVLFGRDFQDYNKYVNSKLFLKMTAKSIILAVVGSGVLGFALDYVISDKKLFGGTTPSTMTRPEWWEETDRKFQAWPRTAGPPVVMNPISRQNFIVKTPSPDA